jgi:hypothetical protein
MMRNKMMKVLTMVAGLAVAAPVMAAKPVQKPAAPVKAPPVKKFETDCFTVSLPGYLVPFKRKKKYPVMPWLGSWGWTTVGQARTKVLISCRRFVPGPFQGVINASIAKLKTKVAGYKQLELKIDKDEGRNYGLVMAQGFMKVLDPKTKKSTAREHVIARMVRRYHETKILVSITVATTGTRSGRIEPLLAMIANSFDPIDGKELDKLRKEALQKKVPPKLPPKAGQKG